MNQVDTLFISHLRHLAEREPEKYKIHRMDGIGEIFSIGGKWLVVWNTPMMEITQDGIDALAGEMGYLIEVKLDRAKPTIPVEWLWYASICKKDSLKLRRASTDFADKLTAAKHALMAIIAELYGKP